jgi:transcription initiation factor IIE alpha subunit
MRLIVISFIFSLFVLFSCAEKDAAKEQAQVKMEHQTMMVDTTAEKLVYYTCPMPEHKEIHSTVPGKCSLCNMAMVKAVVTTEEKKEFYGCPMPEHSYVRQDTAGTCPDCGMQLKPMRLVKE